MNSLMCQVSHSLLHYLFLTFKYHCLLCKVCLSLLCNINYSLRLVQFYLREPFKKKNPGISDLVQNSKTPPPYRSFRFYFDKQFFFIWEFSTLKHVLNHLQTCSFASFGDPVSIGSSLTISK